MPTETGKETPVDERSPKPKSSTAEEVFFRDLIAGAGANGDFYQSKRSDLQALERLPNIRLQDRGKYTELLATLVFQMGYTGETGQTAKNLYARAAEKIYGGKTEPAMRITYAAKDIKGDNYLFFSPEGRPCGYLVVDYVVPESVGKALLKELQDHPDQATSLIRGLVEETILKKIKITERAWKKGYGADPKNSLRPPYEAWAQAAGGKSKMILDLADSPMKIIDI